MPKGWCLQYRCIIVAYVPDCISLVLSFLGEQNKKIDRFTKNLCRITGGKHASDRSFIAEAAIMIFYTVCNRERESKASSLRSEIVAIVIHYGVTKGHGNTNHILLFIYIRIYKYKYIIYIYIFRC